MCIRDRYIGAYAPYGYKKDEKDHHRLIVDEEAAKVVRSIFSYYLEAVSYTHLR